MRSETRRTIVLSCTQKRRHLQEKRIDDNWNVDVNRSVSDPWKRIHEVHSISKKKKTKGYVWSGERLTKNQATCRPDNLWPEVWLSMSKAVREGEKHQ